MTNKLYKLKPINWKGDGDCYAHYGNFYFQICQEELGVFEVMVYDDRNDELLANETCCSRDEAKDWCLELVRQEVLPCFEEVNN